MTTPAETNVNKLPVIVAASTLAKIITVTTAGTRATTVNLCATANPIRALRIASNTRLTLHLVGQAAPPTCFR